MSSVAGERDPLLLPRDEDRNSVRSRASSRASLNSKSISVNKIDVGEPLSSVLDNAPLKHVESRPGCCLCGLGSRSRCCITVWVVLAIVFLVCFLFGELLVIPALLSSQLDKVSRAPCACTPTVGVFSYFPRLFPLHISHSTLLWNTASFPQGLWCQSCSVAAFDALFPLVHVFLMWNSDGMRLIAPRKRVMKRWRGPTHRFVSRPRVSSLVPHAYFLARVLLWVLHCV